MILGAATLWLQRRRGSGFKLCLRSPTFAALFGPCLSLRDAWVLHAMCNLALLLQGGGCFRSKAARQMNHMASDFALLVQPLFALANKSCTPCLLCFIIIVTSAILIKVTGPTHPARGGDRRRPPTHQ